MKVANLGRMQQPQEPVYTNILGSAHRQFVSFKTYEFELLEVVRKILLNLVYQL